MTYKIFTIILVIIGISGGCNKKTKKSIDYKNIDYSNIQKQRFDNFFAVMPDSCLKWNLPITSFAVEYPNNFYLYNTEDFHKDQKYFQIESYQNNKLLRKNIFFSYCLNVFSEKDVEELLNIIDKGDSDYYKDQYEKIKVEHKKIGDNLFHIVYARLWTSKSNLAYLEGYYLLITGFCQSNYSNIAGVMFAILKKYNYPDSVALDKEDIDILETFRFVY